MTLYATMRVHPRYGEANTTMSGGAKHTTCDENDVHLLPLYQWQPTDAKLLSRFIFGKPKENPFSVISLICLRAKPEWLHNATGKFLSTVLSREMLLHFENYELDTKEGTTTVHYGPALPVFYKSGYWSLMIACDFPTPLGSRWRIRVLLEPWSRVFQRCIPHHLGRPRARGYRPPYSMNARLLGHGSLYPKTIYTCDNGSELDLDHLAGTHLPWLVSLGNPSHSITTLEIEPHHGRLTAFRRKMHPRRSRRPGYVIPK